MLCLTLTVLALIMTGCGTHEDLGENGDTIEVLPIETALASSALQYPATNDLFYYNVYDDYIAITKYIGDGTFVENNGSFTPPTSIKIPDVIDGLPVYVIGDNAFASATIEKIEISNNVVSIGAAAFKNCKNLKEVHFVAVQDLCDGRETANGVRTIGASAFEECAALSSIIIPDSIESIEASAFAGCTSLKKINFPNTIVAIPENVCFNCTNLEEIYISDSAVEIADSAFHGVSPSAQIYGGVYSQAAHYAAKYFMLFVINRELPEPVVSN